VNQPGGLDHLAHQRRLAHLPRARHHLDETAALPQAAGELASVRAREHGLRFTQYVE